MADEKKSISAIQIVASLIVLLTIAGMIWAVAYGGDLLKEPEKVNGLIKFSFAIVGIAITLIVVFYLVSDTHSAEGTSTTRSELMAIVARITPMQWVATSIGLLTIGGMVWVISTGADFFEKAEKARALITFSVAIVTVSIALLLVFYLVLSNGTEAENKVKERFTFGKDVLLVFVGILGTIMGFYYGADTVSSDKYADLAKTVQTDIAEKSPIADLEKKGFVALLAKDFEAAVQAFADAYKINPTYHNVDEINKLLNQQKAAFAKAKADKNIEEADRLWKVVFCDISENKRTLGMLPEMIAQVKKNCPPAATPTPSSTTSPTATQPQ